MSNLRNVLFNNFHCYQKNFAWKTVQRCIHSGQMMTSQEVATALRPFIFIVHPDRFWNHPKEKNTNEVSLKRLNAFLDDKLSKKMDLNEQIITFYMRNNNVSSKNVQSSTQTILKKIDIKLNSSENINTTVHRILSQCSLPTDYLQKIGKQPNNKPNLSNARQTSRETDGFYKKNNEYFYNKELFDELEHEFVKSKMEVNFLEWLKDNYMVALKKLEASRPIQNELNRLKKELIEELNLVDLKWNCDWGVSHIRGCLNNLSVLAKQYPKDFKNLNLKTVVFNRYSGISLDGQVMLSIEDVRNSWLDLIRSIKSHDQYVTNLPTAEQVLSDLLQGIQIIHPSYNLWSAKKYFKQLEKLTKSVKEYKCNQSFPTNWPHTLSEYRLIVEFDSGPLMLSPSGDFIAPASCPISLLVRFISENLNKASQTLKNDEFNINLEKRIRGECIAAFGLEYLEKDDNITPEQMIDFGRRILEKKEYFRPYLNGTQLRVSMYYSVLHDGQICVPYNFTV